MQRSAVGHLSPVTTSMSRWACRLHYTSYLSLEAGWLQQIVVIANYHVWLDQLHLPLYSLSLVFRFHFIGLVLNPFRSTSCWVFHIITILRHQYVFITFSIFYSMLKTHISTNPFHHKLLLSFRGCRRALGFKTCCSTVFIFTFFDHFLCVFVCGKLLTSV